MFRGRAYKAVKLHFRSFKSEIVSCGRTEQEEQPERKSCPYILLKKKMDSDYCKTDPAPCVCVGPLNINIELDKRAMYAVCLLTRYPGQSLSSFKTNNTDGSLEAHKARRPRHVLLHCSPQKVFLYSFICLFTHIQTLHLLRWVLLQLHILCHSWMNK